MKFNYNLEIDNILNKIYKRKIFDLACENNISNIDSKNIESYKNQFKSFEVYLGSEIEEFIKDMLKEEDFIEIQRNELAEHFNCVPSQINYVISTRFRPSQGYYVESR